MLIHALSDSYAHVRGVDPDMRAYNAVYGHAAEPLLGHANPDKIERAIGVYLAFAQALFESLARPAYTTAAHRLAFCGWLRRVEASGQPPRGSKFSEWPLTGSEIEYAETRMTFHQANAFLASTRVVLELPGAPRAPSEAAPCQLSPRTPPPP